MADSTALIKMQFEKDVHFQMSQKMAGDSDYRQIFDITFSAPPLASDWINIVALAESYFSNLVNKIKETYLI